VVPVRSKKSEPGLIDSQTGATEEMCRCNSWWAVRVNDKSGGITRRPGQISRPRAMGMPG